MATGSLPGPSTARRCWPGHDTPVPGHDPGGHDYRGLRRWCHRRRRLHRAATGPPAPPAAGAEVLAVVRPGVTAPLLPDGLIWSRRTSPSPAPARGCRRSRRPRHHLQPRRLWRRSRASATPRSRAQLNTELVVELVDRVRAAGAASWSGQRLVHAGSALEYGTASGDLAEATIPAPTTLYGTTKLAGTAGAEPGHDGGSAARSDRQALHRLRTGRAVGPAAPLTDRSGTRRCPAPAHRRDAATRLHLARRCGGGAAAPRRARPDEAVGTVNLATGRLITVRDFVERAAACSALRPTGSTSGPCRPAPRRCTHDDVSVARLESLIGWRPTTSIEDGVRHTLAEAVITPSSWRRYHSTVSRRASSNDQRGCQPSRSRALLASRYCRRISCRASLRISGRRSLRPITVRIRSTTSSTDSG